MNPELDSTPACRDWLRMIGFRESLAMGWLVSPPNSQSLAVFVDNSGRLCTGATVLRDKPTRGQVRSLCRVLEIELEEE